MYVRFFIFFANIHKFLQFSKKAHTYKFLFFISCASSFLLTSCAGSDLSEIQKEGPDTIYNQALANFSANNLSEAAKKFSAVDRQFPYSDWARKSLIMGTYVNYLKQDYQDAINSAKRFIERYPKDNDAAYAYYMIGLSYYAQIPDVERDQETAKSCILAMFDLIDHYPDSKFVPDALTKIYYSREHLAGYEMHIARYYQTNKNYLAALSRYKVVIDQYSDTNQIQEALYRCVEISLYLGLKKEAIEYASLLGQNYPKNVWYRNAYQLLKKQKIIR